MIASMRVLFCVMHDDQRMTRPCPRLLPTFKAWLLSTRSFVRKVYGVFRSGSLEKSSQKSILSWRCHKFNQKRRYDKWNFAFFRLDKCERWQQLLHRCFETLIVCPCLLIANTTLLAFNPVCASFLEGGGLQMPEQIIFSHFTLLWKHTWNKCWILPLCLHPSHPQQTYSWKAKVNLVP